MQVRGREGPLTPAYTRGGGPCRRHPWFGNAVAKWQSGERYRRIAVTKWLSDDVYRRIGHPAQEALELQKSFPGGSREAPERLLGGSQASPGTYQGQRFIDFKLIFQVMFSTKGYSDTCSFIELVNGLAKQISRQLRTCVRL